MGPIRKLFLPLFALAVALLTAPAASAQIVFANPDFENQIIVDNLDFPTAMAWAPDGRMFIVEKKGVLKVLNPGAQDAVQLLDISSIVGDEADRGLLGVAVDAAYAANNFVYLLYTRDTGLVNDDAGPMVSQLARYTITPANAVTGSTVILGTHVPASGGCPAPSNTLDCIPSDSETHSIGSVRAAADGTLWVGSGDGADYGDVDPLAFRTYDEQSYAGKIMHVGRDGLGLAGHPFCPADSNLTHVCTKHFAKGFRNPFRFHLRPGGLAVGDVGWNTREELDLLRFDQPGRSYGWPCYEGTIQTPGYKDTPECAAEYAKPPGTHLAPAYDYAQNPEGAAYAGPLYTATNYPGPYRDKYFVGDYANGTLDQVAVDAQDQVTGVEPFVTGLGSVAVELAPNGNIAHVALFGGSVEEFVFTPGSRTPDAVASADPTSGSAPLQVHFTGSDSSDPDEETLTYDWDFGDGSPHSSLADPVHTYANPGDYTATLTVTDPTLRTDSDSVSISAGNDPPNTPTISTPADESLYRDGQAVAVAGSASDPQEGNLPASALTWNVILHHGSHDHPILNQEGVASTSFEPSTDHDADSFYDVTLTAEDSSGLTRSRTIQVRPETVDLGIQSSPTGAPISYAGSSFTTPFSTLSAVGFETSVSAAQQFTQAGQTWQFDHWSDGGSRLHNITIPATDTTLTAVYQNVTPGNITISKQTDPVGSSEQFGFTGALGPFSLTGATGGNSRTVQVAAGTYAVTESAKAGWRLAQLTCSDTSAINGATATIDLAPGENVTCVFANTKQGTVTVVKQTDPVGSAEQFDFTGALGPFSLSGATGGNSHAAQVDPGTYAVTESGEASWDLTQLICSDGSPTAGRTATVGVAAGENVTCTYVNTREGSITVEKQTHPNGAADRFDFSGNSPLGNFTLSDGEIHTASVDAGSYSVSEAAMAGWDLSGIECSDGSPALDGTATIQVSTGEAVRCVFTNVQRGHVTIRALTDPPEQPPAGVFAFTGGSLLGSFELGHRQNAQHEVPPGIYLVQQAPTDGYALEAVTCDDADSTGSAPGREAIVRLAAGEAVACTFTAEAESGTASPVVAISRLSKRRRAVLGSVRDGDGVDSLEIAIGRALRKPGRCRWWSKKAGRLPARSRRCSRPRWIKAELTGADEARDWLARLGASLPAGRYRVLIQTVDGLDNRSTVRLTLRSSAARSRSRRTAGRTRSSSG